jgi:soluble lytic murein transglycosylase-like protein
VKFAIEGLDELLTGLVGVQDAEAAAKAMAERRGLTYTPSAAVTRRNQASSAYVSRFAGARDAAFARAQQITGAPAAAVPLPVVPAPAGGGGGSKAKKEKGPSIEEIIAGRPFGREILAAAKAEGVDPALFAALVEQESGNRQTAISRSGAIGLAQLMPGTARELGVNPYDALQNLMGGAKYLRQQIDRFGLEGGLRAYNQGPGAQQRTPGGNSQESREYPGRVLERYRSLTGAEGNIEQLTAEGYKAQTQSTEQFREQQQQIAGQIAEGNQALQERTREIDRQAELARAVNDIERRTLEYYFQQEDIQDRFDKLRDEALEQHKQALKFGVEFNLQDKLRLIGEQENRELQLAEYNTAKELLDLRYAENDAIAERVRMMQDLTRQASEPTVFNVLEQQKAQLDEILQKYPAIGQAADAAATLATNGMAEMIAGTKSAKEVFADFLQGIASALIDTAKKMIAQYIAIGIARMFAGIGAPAVGGFSGSSAGPFGAGGISPALSFPTTGFANGGIMSPSGPLPLKAYSRGGVASTPQVALFGEGSMNEAYVPLPDGRRIPVALQAPDGNRGDRMRELMGASPAGSNASPVLSMSFETTTINGVEYVSRDQLESAMAETRKRAANDGAKRGMSMTLDRLQQSPATRSKVGIR